jgi:hypothetical protein
MSKFTIEAKFTPSPWMIEDLTLYRGDEMIIDNNGHFIAAIMQRKKVNKMDKQDAWDETNANSKLIVNAPDLFNALQDIIEQFDKIGGFDGLSDLQDSINIFGRKALLKATL